MSKLNKIFLAVIIALLVTAVAEVIFIFVYKPVQSIPNPPTATAIIPTSTPFLPLPNNPAINPGFMSAMKTWLYFPNQSVTVTDSITGTIASITPPSAQNNRYIIKLQGIKGKELTQLNVSPQDLADGVVLVFRVDTSGNNIPTQFQSLAVGQNIIFNQIYNAYTSKDDNNPQINIIIQK